jgi:hypothetical protein
MRAKQVYEFKQGGNPYDTMEIGSNRPIEEGAKFIVKYNLFYFRGNKCAEYELKNFGEYDEMTTIFDKNDIVEIRKTIDSDTGLYYISRTPNWSQWIFQEEEIKKYMKRV